MFVCLLRVDVQNNNQTDRDEEYELRDLYFGLASISFFLNLFSIIPVAVFCAIASRTLHDTMFSRVMYAPSRFYDMYPVGKYSIYSNM